MADRRYAAYGCRVQAIAIALALSLIIALPGMAFGWFADWRLTQDPAGSFTSPNNARAITCDAQGTIHIVWYDGREGNYEIYHTILS